ncbi:ESX secretion-associated protein EspG [Nocardia yunnanensis]|uniref:ESX secretion-associated protein EspG n=1 Tax=Nocardia yunnanensis TaxID=2382165 RepID=A0A386ZKC7_9NOCA|nr:ESX secretion-associated protein EspG [Nocardia yunnanensis]AYF77055.1 ESX secretion-associated protein EspG [Nocardia yunnanensis]
MLRSWTFTDLEFLVLWQDLGEEHLPSPLWFTSRDPLWNAFQDSKTRARDGLRDRDPDFAEVLRVLHTPEVRVELRGWDGADWRLPEAGIRALGVRSGEAGYLVVQQPGETIGHAAGFTISECWAADLTAELVALMPDIPAGHGPDLVLAAAADVVATEYDYGLSPAHETLEGGIVDRTAEFLSAPVSRRGAIEVVQGRSRFGPRGITRHQLEWRDLVGDGRYLITADQPPVAVPADRRRVIEELETRIAEVGLAIADEWEVNQ